MKSIVFLTFRFCWSLFKTRKSLVLENLMLRQQLNIYKRKNKRPKLENIDIKQEETAKCGIKIKRHKAGWNEKYLEKILGI